LQSALRRWISAMQHRRSRTTAKAAARIVTAITSFFGYPRGRGRDCQTGWVLHNKPAHVQKGCGRHAISPIVVAASFPRHVGIPNSVTDSSIIKENPMYVGHSPVEDFRGVTGPGLTVPSRFRDMILRVRVCLWEKMKTAIRGGGFLCWPVSTCQ
jgi:hypothetical protein